MAGVVWLVDAGHSVVAQSPGAPPLPDSLAVDGQNGRRVTAALGQSGAYRLEQARYGGRLLAAGLSQAGDNRIERWLLVDLPLRRGRTGRSGSA